MKQKIDQESVVFMDSLLEDRMLAGLGFELIVGSDTLVDGRGRGDHYLLNLFVELF